MSASSDEDRAPLQLSVTTDSRVRCVVGVIPMLLIDDKEGAFVLAIAGADDDFLINAGK